MFVCFFCTARWIYAENENCHIFGFLNFYTTNAWWSVQRYYMMWYFEGMIYIFSPFNYHFALSIIVVRTDLILFWLFEYTNRFSSVNHTNSIKTGLLRFEQDIFGQKCNRQGGESVLKIQKPLTNTEIFQYLSVPISIC